MERDVHQCVIWAAGTVRCCEGLSGSLVRGACCWTGVELGVTCPRVSLDLLVHIASRATWRWCRLRRPQSLCLPGARPLAVQRRLERRLGPGCVRSGWGRKRHLIPGCPGLVPLVRIASRATWPWGRSRRPRSLDLCPVHLRPSAIAVLRETDWGGPALHSHVHTACYGPLAATGCGWRRYHDGSVQFRGVRRLPREMW